MHLLYVDESGDPGIINSPTKYFILSAIIIHELRWKDVLSSLVDFRKSLKATKGIKIREEIHCSELINRPGDLKRIPRNERVDIIKKCIVWLNNQPDISIFSVCVNKTNKKKSDVFEIAWTTLIQRFENTIEAGNFNGPKNDHERGIILSDDTDSKRLTHLIRKMRHYNAIPNNPMHGLGYRDLTLKYVVEDPIFRNSSNASNE